MSRHLAIGDIHGCYDALTTLADFVGIGDSDTLVTLGDYVDRGPKTKEVLDWLIKFDETNRLIPLRGNHEIMMLSSRVSKEAKVRWGQFGAIETLDSYAGPKSDDPDLDDIPEAHWQFLSKRLVPYHETATHLFVHGSVDPMLPLDEQSDYVLFWSQYSDRFPGHCSGKKMICGHKSQHSGLPVTNGHAVCIDTRACKGGWLTCLDVDAEFIWQANEEGDTRTMTLGELSPEVA